LGVVSDINMKWLVRLDLVVGVIFLGEVAYYLMFSVGTIWEKITSDSRLVEGLNIFEIFWFAGGG
jgi:hypothetical protein